MFIARRSLFWYLCNISMFELLAVPQRVIPYVQNLASWVVFTQWSGCNGLNYMYIAYGTKRGNSNKTLFIFQDQNPRRRSPHHNHIRFQYRQEAAKNVRLRSPTNWPNCTVWGRVSQSRSETLAMKDGGRGTGSRGLWHRSVRCRTQWISHHTFNP
jgi:hypothetical protein